MDDGSFGRGGLYLHTQGFSDNDNVRLQQALGKCFGFKVSIHKDNRKTGSLSNLYIAAENRENFFKLVSPYIHPVFQYKLPEHHRGFFEGRVK